MYITCYKRDWDCKGIARGMHGILHDGIGRERI